MVNLPYSEDWVEPYLAARSNIPGWFGEEDVRLFSIIDRIKPTLGFMAIYSRSGVTWPRAQSLLVTCVGRESTSSS